MSLRQLARVLDAKANTSRRSGNLNESLNCWRDILHLSQSINHHALLLHFCIASAIESYATSGIYRTLPAMDSSQCKALIPVLIEFDRNRVDFDGVRQREMVWMVKTGGWMNHLGYLMENLEYQGDTNRLEREIYQKDRAIIRLLLIETAARAYQLDHGRPPARLNDLVSKYLTAIPNDPFAIDSRAFHYSTTATKFKLWSVGYDGKDDNGAPLPKNEYGGVSPGSEGDLWLEDYFVRDESPKTDPENNAKAIEASSSSGDQIEEK